MFLRAAAGATLVAAIFLFLATESRAEAQGEVCQASYYSWELEGSQTASGELFNPLGFTAAHLWHPFGTWLFVYSFDTHRGVFVVVNDRGPYVNGRCVDVSLAAAEALGMTHAGTANVVVVPVWHPH